MQPFSIANNGSTPRDTLNSNSDDSRLTGTTISPLDQARAYAPFVIGTSVRQYNPCIHIGCDGSYSKESTTKQDFAQALGLNIRDLRILDKSPPNRKEAGINVRNNLIIISIEGIKVVIGPDEVIIFCPDESIAEVFLPYVQRQIEAEGDIMGNRFEHIVLEAVLSCACSAINEEFIELVNQLNLDELLKLAQSVDDKESQPKMTFRRALRSNTVKDMIRKSEMTPLKAKLSKLRKRVLEVIRVLTEILDDDDLFRGLFLTSIDSRKSLRLSLSSRSKALPNFGLGNRMSSASGVGDAVSNPTPVPAAVLANNPRSRRRASMLGGNVCIGTVGPAPTGQAPIYSESSSSGTDTPASPIQGSPPVSDVSADQIQNCESIIDCFIAQFNWMASEIEDTSEHIASAESTAALQLDIIRNRIMRYTVYMSVISCSICFPTLLTGIFGMNMKFPEYLGRSLDPFYATVFSVAFSVPLLVCLILGFLSTRKVF